ncbi:MAG: hypothetical protein A2Y14_02095 [Verrucomicrobia bacterium GWF2_51_19]|nr:MAG: hypothetical protein A2Y14_02095 [Verrucomicrobia bacterium GWF2_51_19]
MITIFAFLLGLSLGCAYGLWRVRHFRERVIRLEVQQESERIAFREKLELLEASKEKLADAFKALASEALNQNSGTFLSLAEKSFATLQMQATSELDKKEHSFSQLLSPIKESLSKFDEHVKGIEKERVNAYARLVENIRELSETHGLLRKETANLTKALKEPNTRGQWGEMHLKRAVEAAGMIEHVDFDEQVHFSDGNTIQRPDMVIRLPNGRTVIIDAKVPDLNPYLQAIESSNNDRQRHLKDYASYLKERLVKLSSKAYQKQFEDTPEFVVLFLPMESFFSAALEGDPSLIDFGVQSNVLLATPTTLIALLKAVAYGWKQESITREAKYILNLGNELYNRIEVFTRHFSDIRKGLEKAVDAYNSSLASLERNVLSSAKKFHALHSSSSTEIPSIAPIEAALRAFE